METNIKVLVIEDRRENIVFLANNILKPKGFNVITAMDGEAGLRKALEESPDLIITDLKLPKMHGLDVLADLQDRGANIPTIVMTFHGSEDTAIKAFRLGAKDYLIKPFSVEAVEMALERALAQSPNSNIELEKHAQQLEAQVSELQKLVKEQQETQNASVNNASLPEEGGQYQQEVERWKLECAKLSELLAHKKNLTNEARNSAKTMIQFIRLQQKEVLKKQNEAVQLSQQVQMLSKNFNAFVSKLEMQARQFQGPPK